MVKRFFVVLLAFFIFLFSVSASKVCDLDVKMINQNPFPAVQGDYVEIVFQVSGLEKEGCGDITFELLPIYPISFDPGKSGVQTFYEVVYLKDFRSNILVPYKVRVDKEALDGDNPIEVRVSTNKKGVGILKTFNLKVKDTRSDFDVYVKDYNYKTNTLILEVLNVGKSDVEALVVEIPKQEGIQVKGANKKVVGDLDLNDYTTADFEATIKDGKFKVILTYSDKVNYRRSVEREVYFDSSYFTNRKADEVKPSYTIYYVIGGVLLFILYLGYKSFSKARARRKRLEG